MMIDTPEGIEAFRLLAIKGRLGMELKGLKFRGGSTFAYVKRMFGFTGNRQKVYDQYIDMLKHRGVLIQK